MSFWTIFTCIAVLACGLNFLDAWRDGNQSAKWGWFVAFLYAIVELMHRAFPGY